MGGVYLKTVISYNMLSKPVFNSMRAAITKANKPYEMQYIPKHAMSQFIFSENPRAKLAQLLCVKMKTALKSQSSHQVRL